VKAANARTVRFNVETKINPRPELGARPAAPGVVNDNNYPFSVGRHLGTGRTDDDDLIEVALGQPLG
jgi:hypothetical protein